MTVVFLLSLFLASAALVAADPTPATIGGPRVIVDAGIALPGSVYERTVLVGNPGPVVLRWGLPVTSCSCARVRPDGDEVPAGGALRVVMTVRWPSGHAAAETTAEMRFRPLGAALTSEPAVATVTFKARLEDYLTLDERGNTFRLPARALADDQVGWDLARGDGTPDRSYSMSARIAAERKEYYLQLEIAQRGSTDITAWVLWFLGCLERAIDAADGMLATVLRVWQSLAQAPVNDRQRLVINRLIDDWQGHLMSSKYDTLATCSSDTAQRDIKHLVGRGVLAQNDAGGRSTGYRLVE